VVEAAVLLADKAAVLMEAVGAKALMEQHANAAITAAIIISGWEKVIMVAVCFVRLLRTSKIGTLSMDGAVVFPTVPLCHSGEGVKASGGGDPYPKRNHAHK